MSSSPPPISVLTPVYNAERYLAEALQSILNQSFGDFEFIIVDDGSKDRSLEIIQEFAKQDDRIQFISRPNTGIVGALNDGLKQVRGEYIARMDADDVAMPNRFERQLAFMREHQDVVGTGCRCLVIDEDDDPVNIWGQTTDHDEIERNLFKGIVSVLHHSSAMFRHDTIRTLGGYRTDIGVSEDLDLYLRLSEQGRLTNVTEMLMIIRRHPASISASRTAKQQAETRVQCIHEALRRRGRDPSEIDTTFRTTNRTPYQASRIRSVQAVKNHFPTAARKYARRAFRMSPWNKESWRLLLKAYSCRPIASGATTWWDAQRTK